MLLPPFISGDAKLWVVGLLPALIGAALLIGARVVWPHTEDSRPQ